MIAYDSQPMISYSCLIVIFRRYGDIDNVYFSISIKAVFIR